MIVSGFWRLYSWWKLSHTMKEMKKILEDSSSHKTACSPNDDDKYNGRKN